MSKIIESLNWRYATKKFDTTKILSKQKIDVLKQAFNLTATSFGLQTISMIIVSNKDLKKRFIEHSYYQKQVAEASHLLILCIQEDIFDSDIVSYYDNIKAIRNTSEEILKPYRSDLIKTIKKMTVEERQQWSLNQAYIALGNLMTVCAIEGIDSCPMEGFISKKYDEILNLKEKNLKSVLLLPVGYRADDDMFASFKKVRKSLDETIIEIN
jgi:nitroreductase